MKKYDDWKDKDDSIETQNKLIKGFKDEIKSLTKSVDDNDKKQVKYIKQIWNFLIMLTGTLVIGVFLLIYTT